MEYERLRKNADCWKCLGCQLLENKTFTGIFNCNRFVRCDKAVWCANETIEEWNNSRRIKKD